jgi:hypothetical protein
MDKKNVECKHCHTTENLVTDCKGRTQHYCYSCKSIEFKARAEKRTTTVLDKYGVSNISQLQYIKDEKSDTSFKKTGYRHTLQIPEIRKKYEELTGFSNPSYNPIEKEKRKITSIENCGYSSNLKDPKFRAYTEERMIELYGVKNPQQSPDIREETKKTNIIRYGHEYPMQNKEISKKAAATYLENTGYNTPFADPVIQENIKNKFRENNWINFTDRITRKRLEILFDEEYYLSNNVDFKFKCKICDKLHIFDTINPARIWCGCLIKRSHYEIDIADWLKHTYLIETEMNKRFQIKGHFWFEIDVYLPEYNLGIDYHGLFYHSDEFKSRLDHQEKYLYFKSIGIDYIQVFEHEWAFKLDIIQSIISNRLRKNSNIIQARKCIIREVSFNDSKEFLLKNHLQGNTVSKYRYGLYYNEELISVATFSLDRFSKDKKMELLRFSNKLNTVVIGGFQKLLKYSQNILK